MGCVGSKPKDETNYGYMQKDTLYYKIREKNSPGGNQPKHEIQKDNIKGMVNESLSSVDSGSEESDSERNDTSKDPVHNRHNEPTSNILYKHKPMRPSKLKELDRSDSKFDRSDTQTEKENAPVQ